VQTFVICCQRRPLERPKGPDLPPEPTPQGDRCAQAEAAIGPVEVAKIEKKGRQNRRVQVTFDAAETMR